MLYTDQLGRVVSLSKTPQRIVSLVPSQTELLVDLGLENNLVGVTKFCVHPKGLKKRVPVIGGTKKVHVEKIQDLSPDIIICNKEENTKAIVEDCETIAPVWVSDITTLEDALRMVKLLGDLLQKQSHSNSIVSGILEAKTKFELNLKKHRNLRVLYLIWKNPYMAAGSDTFINSLLQMNGFFNVMNEERYPEVNETHFEKTDVVFLSSEPFPFKEEHAKALQDLIKKPVLIVDGEFFSWYGSRLTKAFTYFNILQEQLSEIVEP